MVTPKGDEKGKEQVEGTAMKKGCKMGKVMELERREGSARGGGERAVLADSREGLEGEISLKFNLISEKVKRPVAAAMWKVPSPARSHLLSFCSAASQEM